NLNSRGGVRGVELQLQRVLVAVRPRVRVEVRGKHQRDVVHVRPEHGVGVEDFLGVRGNGLAYTNDGVVATTGDVGHRNKSTHTNRVVAVVIRIGEQPTAITRY